MSSQSDYQHQQAVIEWARQFALIRRELPTRETQDKLQDLWRAVRDALNEQHHEILEIRSIASAGQLELPPRPLTTSTVAECRKAVEHALEEAAAEVQDASATIGVLKDIPPHWARNFLLRKYKTSSTSDSVLGCWICNLQPGHPNGYIKINLRNTTCNPPGSNSFQPELGIQPWLHQLVIVGKGQGAMLPLTTGTGGYEVSHLCHNPACFNPEHIVVERAELNRARNSCHDRVVFEVEGLIVINPCPHWNDAAWNLGERGLGKACVLPTMKIPKEMIGG